MNYLNVWVTYEDGDEEFLTIGFLPHPDAPGRYINAQTTLSSMPVSIEIEELPNARVVVRKEVFSGTSLPYMYILYPGSLEIAIHA